MPLPPAPFTALALAVCCASALARETIADEPASRVVVNGHYDNALGTSDAASQGVIRAELLKSRPAQRPGEVLEFVPGVIVTQHSGDGKANQYFLRGFNLDHGTDFATRVDGLPVNMPSHGHGQGYSDLNFLIPELVDRIDYRKGPYFARQGDFSAAGSADIHYRRSFAAPAASLTFGEHGHRRLFVGGSARAGGAVDLLGAVEGTRNDGPWTLPEHLRKTSAVLRATQGDARAGWRLGLSAYEARWQSTDQVPQRAIDDGRLGRFDAVDPSNGGGTGRYGASAQLHRRDGDDGWQVSAWALRYRLRLFSNFTYALDRPQEGDQFSQRDRRDVLGLEARQDWGYQIGSKAARTEVGVQLRHDRIRVGLDDTVARRPVQTTRDDRVRQTAWSVHAEQQLQWAEKVRGIVGVRFDRFDFRVDDLLELNGGRSSDTQVSPKLSLVFGPWQRTELFLNAGRGFHSNDARGTTARVDPKTGAPADAVQGLVPSRGWEVGLRSEALPGWQGSLALWRLRSDSELVYVGDAGTTEPNRPSRREGVEWNNRWIPRPWLLLDADLAWSRARFSDGDPAGDRIPGAVGRVASVAVSLRDVGPWSGSLQWRYLGPRPLVEDGSVRAAASSLLNARVARRLGARWTVSLDLFNLANRRANDIEYFYESRLPGEAAAVADVHLHPVQPRTVRLTMQTEM